MTELYRPLDNFELIATDAEGVWSIAYRPDDARKGHQLYVDNQLISWTRPGDSSIPVRLTGGPVLVDLVEVAAEHLQVARPAGQLTTPLGCVVSILPNADWPAGSMAYLMLQPAEGEPAELASRPVPSNPTARTGLGRDALGRGMFGYDVASAPGLKGSFGMSSFGWDGKALRLSTMLPDGGSREVFVRIAAPDGRTVDSAATTVQADALPPPAPTRLNPVAYDPEGQILTLEIIEESNG